MLQYGFATMNLAKIWARADVRNERSIHVMENIGMTKEAHLRSHRVDRHGVRCDEVVYGIIRSEWHA